MHTTTSAATRGATDPPSGAAAGSGERSSRRAGTATSTPMNTSAGIVTPGMSQSKSTTPCTTYATAPANSATARSRSRPAAIPRNRASAANSKKPSAPIPSAAPMIPVSARNCSGTLCGCSTSNGTWRYMRCVTGNEPAPQPPIGLSFHAPAASFHHTQRLPEFEEMIRVGSESRSWLVFVNSCQASSKNRPGPALGRRDPEDDDQREHGHDRPQAPPDELRALLAPLRALLEAQHPPRRDQQADHAAGHDEAQDDPVRRALVERDVDPLQAPAG